MFKYCQLHAIEEWSYLTQIGSEIRIGSETVLLSPQGLYVYWYFYIPSHVLLGGRKSIIKNVIECDIVYRKEVTTKTSLHREPFTVQREEKLVLNK